MTRIKKAEWKKITLGFFLSSKPNRGEMWNKLQSHKLVWVKLNTELLLSSCTASCYCEIPSREGTVIGLGSHVWLVKLVMASS